MTKISYVKCYDYEVKNKMKNTDNIPKVYIFKYREPC